jgi:hypothetical protein
MKRAVIVPALVTAFVALSPVGVAFADNPHLDSNGNRVTTGQPSKSEEDNPTLIPPGHNSPGFIDVGSQHYANGTDSPLNPSRGNTDKAVSQYDVAGFQCSQHLNCPGPK